MSDAARPMLVVVTGRPGAGKTTLAHLLARKVGCPAICRDEIKEGLVSTTGEKGTPGDAIARQVHTIFFDTVEFLLRRNVTLVAEAAFQHQLWAPRLEPLRGAARIRIVHCIVNPVVARSRIRARITANPVRARHHDALLLPQLEAYEPPRLTVPTISVDTSDGYRPDLDELLAFVTR
jgi:predicted kinase